MNAMDAARSILLAVADEPLLARLFLASVEMAVLAALVWLAIRARVIRPARWQSFLWLIVLVKPFMVVAMGALVPIVHLDVAAPPTMATPAPVPLPAEASVETRAVESTLVPHSASPAEIPQSEPSVPATPIARQPWDLPTLLVRVWLLGIILLGAYAGIDRIRLWRLVAHAQPATSELASRYGSLAEALHIKRPPRLRITDALESPALAGLLRPTILLPAWLVHEQESDKLDWSLRHELTHWKLGDVWAHAAQQLAQIVFFFNPVTWWACHRWQEAAELACDRAVVATERDVEVYADNLYQVLAQIHGQRRGLLAGGLFATRTQIGRRIAVLLSNPLKHPARLGTAGVLVLLCVAAISLSVGASFAPGSLSPAPAEIPPDVQNAIDQAIDMLSTTREVERDRVTAVFDIVRGQPQKPALLALCEWTKDNTPTKRRSAVYIIGALEWEDASPAFGPLRALLTHKEVATRGMSALSLASTGDAESYGAFVDMAKKDEDPYARRCAAYALGELGDLRALEPLEEIRKDSNSGVSRNAGNAIERLTFLRDHAGAKGDAGEVVRAIWTIAGSQAFDETRIGRAMDVVRGAAPEVRSALLDEASRSSSEAIRNSASLITARLNEAPLPETPSVSKRDWGPEEATGAPDTQGPGDIVTAWASLTTDEQPEWLLLEYERPLKPQSVKVFETYNPGALVKVSIIDEAGEESIAWEGTDPTRPEQQTGVSEIPIAANAAIRKVKLYLDSPAVPGWNEIDAVGLVDESGQIHWATAATASSTFAEQTSRPAAETAESTPVAEDPATKSLIPQGSVLMTYTDSTAEGKWSLSASGHAIRFERGAQHFLEAVQIAASRYGNPEPPAEDFHLYVLNDTFQIVADVPFPYAMIERGDLRWYTLRTPSIEVPESFYIALAFNPHKTKGVYLAYDANIESPHSYRGLPDSGYEPEDETHDWMIRAYLSAEPFGEKGVQRLADWSPPKHVDPFEGLVEVKYDDGVSDGKQSYGGACPYIRFPATMWGIFARTRLITKGEAVMGLRVYGSRYGSGYDPETTMLHVTFVDEDGKEVAKADFPYSLFSYKERWVDLVLPEPIMSGVEEFKIIFDPEAHQTKGIYFHYMRNPAESHSGIAKNGKADKPTPDREWMIRAYFRR